MSALDALERRVVACRRCPRLVAHREAVARTKVARFRSWDYWGRPVPGFGDPGARILVVSDQTAYFLSYYLLPRQVFHKVHPDAERVIPQPDQQRQLAAYRLEDFSAEELRALDPDFVLEYFEGPAYVDRERLLEDAQWITFVRRLRGDAAYVPPYNVALRPFGEVQARP